jgi:hypothetical protein
MVALKRQTLTLEKRLQQPEWVVDSHLRNLSIQKARNRLSDRIDKVTGRSAQPDMELTAEKE